MLKFIDTKYLDSYFLYKFDYSYFLINKYISNKLLSI